ncbi:MAG TPA: DnaA regulatory inactivator Hda [Gammaproteobacteria bacterium]
MTQQLPLPLVLSPRYRFETFVAARRNQALLAHLSSLTTASPEKLWIWGQSGAGKTHLLQATCAAQAERRAMYLMLREPDELDPGVLDGLEGLDLVALDDIDRVLGSVPWERALFKLLDAAQQDRASVVMSASSPPAAASFGLADLASRAAAAAVYELEPLADAERVLALQRHARARGLELPDEAADYLLKRVRRDMAGLCEWLEALDAASLAAQRKLTIPLIRRTLSERA